MKLPIYLVGIYFKIIILILNMIKALVDNGRTIFNSWKGSDSYEHYW